MADTTLKVGVVGLGRIFDLNSLGYRHHPGAQIVALCDSNPEQLARRRQEFPEAFCTTDYERFLAQKLDLIDVLTPPSLPRRNGRRSAPERRACLCTKTDGADARGGRSHDRCRCRSQAPS